jgi:UDP-N-acetylglucosamine:LPS N-acetylglucosamine transferase
LKAGETLVKRKQIDFVFFDAGGGHRAAATALKSVVEQQGRNWDVRLMNLQEILDAMDIFRRYTGIRMQDVYNRMLANGWTLGSGYLVPVMHALIRMYHPKQVRMLAEFWSHSRPDLVVSVVPNFNRALLQGLHEAHPNVPYVTILTDFADYPPHFWIEHQDQYYICGTDKALEQARRISAAPEKAYGVSGMILRPMFYQTFTHDRRAERERLGLSPDKPTGIVLFGGQGSKKMVRIVQHLQSASRDLQLILVCGRNEKLASRLRSVSSRVPLHVVGFTDDVPYYMSLSDFFIGKPGPGSISEALAMHLPVIIESNAWTLPQERYNAEWVAGKGVGIVLSDVSRIGQAVDDMLEPSALARYRANAAAIENRAVFEIADILEGIISRG